MKEEVRVRFGPSDLRGTEQMRLELRKQPGEASRARMSSWEPFEATHHGVRS